MPGPYIRSAILVGSIPLMAELGGDAIALAHEIGMDPQSLTDADLPVSGASVIEFYERAAERTGCESFGLRMAARTGISVIGSLWVLLRQAQTVEQMLEDLALHFDLYTQGAIVTLHDEGRDRRITWGTVGPAWHSEVQMAEYSMAVLCGELRRHARAGWEPASVRLSHAAPKNRADLRRVLGPHVAFNAPDNSILVERSLLDRPVQASGSRTRALMRHVLRMEQAPADPGLVERVDGLVRTMLPYARCTLADVGRALGMAPRTLQERLQAHGRTFQSIRDAARSDLAAKYLRNSRLSLAQIAEILGYSEPSAFSRSFRRWHGRSARSVRGRRGHADASPEPLK